jgi:hypothetical protein
MRPPPPGPSLPPPPCRRRLCRVPWSRERSPRPHATLRLWRESSGRSVPASSSLLPSACSSAPDANLRVPLLLAPRPDPKAVKMRRHAFHLHQSGRPSHPQFRGLPCEIFELSSSLCRSNLVLTWVPGRGPPRSPRPPCSCREVLWPSSRRCSTVSARSTGTWRGTSRSRPPRSSSRSLSRSNATTPARLVSALQLWN